MKKSDKPNGAPEQSRRRALKTAVLGGAAVVVTPEKWSKPIVDSIVLPAHATTTEQTRSEPVQVLLNTPGGAGEAESYNCYSLKDLIALLGNEKATAEAEAAAAAQASRMNLSDIFVSPAHAIDIESIEICCTTRYYIGTADGTNFNITILRVFEHTGNRYFATGMFTAGERKEIPSTINCAARAYTKNVTLLDVNADNATIQVDIAGFPVYTKVLERNNAASPDTC